ncbi:DUF559 domain-containing protein [Microbacterium amylolyticum]|uniref:Very-short-patch-repair endonuclease n=1 Tax=Microbacterium amylolyticum TaxID=936337 RepID=A0ABS4ZG25_9MICO|nr:DUF559 domain-containing protein [Microbacterium amylolyticum]MBP2436222.1 very-short-patch-repair endonuclease [Microbacterium amylolyticum]
MDVMTDVRSLGGVVRVADLRRRGHGRRAVEGGVQSGALIRPRRGWVALPGADPMLVTAAAGGVVLSCVTAAARSGLWVPDARTPHVAADPRSSGIDARGSHVHWARPLVPRVPGHLQDPIENALALVADCLPHEHALAVWESALSKKLVDRASLLELPLKARARTLAQLATPFSDAGGESFVVDRLRWLHVPVRQQIWIAGHRVDVLIGDRLVVQIDGGTHVGTQRERDNSHDARLRLMGYHVIRVSHRQVVGEWERVQDTIMRAVAGGLHRVRAAS